MMRLWRTILMLTVDVALNGWGLIASPLSSVLVSAGAGATFDLQVSLWEIK